MWKCEAERFEWCSDNVSEGSFSGRVLVNFLLLFQIKNDSFSCLTVFYSVSAASCSSLKLCVVYTEWNTQTQHVVFFTKIQLFNINNYNIFGNSALDKVLYVWIMSDFVTNEPRPVLIRFTIWILTAYFRCVLICTGFSLHILNIVWKLEVSWFNLHEAF